MILIVKLKYLKILLDVQIVINMAKKEKGQGFHSSAGLIRYFDAEEKTALKIPPWFVIAACIATVVILAVIHLTTPVS